MLIRTIDEKTSGEMAPSERPTLATAKPISPRGTMPMPTISIERRPRPDAPTPQPMSLPAMASAVFQQKTGSALLESFGMQLDRFSSSSLMSAVEAAPEALLHGIRSA